MDIKDLTDEQLDSLVLKKQEEAGILRAFRLDLQRERDRRAAARKARPAGAVIGPGTIPSSLKVNP